MTHQTYQLPPDGISQPPAGTGDLPAEGGAAWLYGSPENAQPSGGQMSGGEGASAADGMPAVYPGMDGGGYGSQMPRNLAQSQRMRNPVDMEGTHSPANPRQALQSSLMGLLSRNVGYFLMVTCLLGDRQAVTWQGILHSVGNDYIVLYQPDYERYVSCDLGTVKFVQFHDAKGIPYCAGARAWQGQMGW